MLAHVMKKSQKSLRFGFDVKVLDQLFTVMKIGIPLEFKIVFVDVSNIYTVFQLLEIAF